MQCTDLNCIQFLSGGALVCLVLTEYQSRPEELSQEEVKCSWKNNRWKEKEKHLEVKLSFFLITSTQCKNRCEAHGLQDEDFARTKRKKKRKKK